jgi:hypothetical protein
VVTSPRRGGGVRTGNDTNGSGDDGDGSGPAVGSATVIGGGLDPRFVSSGPDGNPHAATSGPAGFDRLVLPRQAGDELGGSLEVRLTAHCEHRQHFVSTVSTL